MWKSHEIQTLDYAHHDPNSKDSLVQFYDDSDCGSTPLVGTCRLQQAATQQAPSHRKFLTLVLMRCYCGLRPLTVIIVSSMKKVVMLQTIAVITKCSIF